MISRGVGRAGNAENLRRGGSWRGSVWGVDRVAPGEAREARCIDRGLWARTFTSEQRRRDAHHSHGVWCGRTVHAMVATVARAMERVFCDYEAIVFSGNGRVVDGWKE